MKKSHSVLVVIFYLYILFFLSLVCSFRFISSISIALILATSVFLNKIETGRFYNPNLKNFLLIACLLYYLLQFAGLIYTHNPQEGWKHIRIKSTLVAVPVALCCSGYITAKIRQRLLKIYCIILLAAILYCLSVAIKKYISHADLSVFFYHSLVRPISQHAIQFSILIFIGLVSLFEGLRKNLFLVNKMVDVFLICSFTLFVFLLSSKLVIGFYLLYLVYFLFQILKTRAKKPAFIIAFVAICLSTGGLIVFTHNPISHRFTEILYGDLNLVGQKKFDPGNRFNGLQFRLLQWRFVTEILNEKKAWLAGVSPGDAQSYLDQKYISENMYTGTPERGDRGFLGYNTHNQFLEALLQTGIIGLLFFLMICLALIRMAWKRKKAELSFITILVLAYTFSESVLETQYSLLIFLFFPLFFYLDNKIKYDG